MNGPVVGSPTATLSAKPTLLALTSILLSTPVPTPSITPNAVPLINETPILDFDPSQPPEFNLEVLRLSIEREATQELGPGTVVTADLVVFSTSSGPLPDRTVGLLPSGQ